MGKGEIARNEQFLLFPQCFQKVSLCRNGLINHVSEELLWQWEKKEKRSSLQAISLQTNIFPWNNLFHSCRKIYMAETLENNSF